MKHDEISLYIFIDIEIDIYMYILYIYINILCIICGSILDSFFLKYQNHVYM